MFISLAQMVSQLMGSEPAISQPSGFGFPRIGPGPSMATIPSIMVRAGFRSL